MTVMLAVQNLPMDKEVKISKVAAGQQGSTMGLKKGEVVTVKDLIYGAMLLSGNDAAYALAQEVSGSKAKFVKLMNKTARNIGCERTHFKNPTGLDADGHYTTAADMMLITKVALSNDAVRSAAGAKTYKMKKTNKSKARVLKTSNEFIKNEFSGVYAGKTGYWDEENCTAALGYRENGLHLYIVLLGETAKERNNDFNKLVQYAKEKVEGVSIVGKDVEEGKVRIKHGAKTRLKAYTAEKGYAYLPKEASVSLVTSKVVMRGDVKAPVRAGDVVGKLEIYAADELVNEVDLIIKEDVDEGWFTSYLGISNLAAVLICLGVVLLFILYSWIAVLKANQRRRKKQQDGAKSWKWQEQSWNVNRI